MAVKRLAKYLKPGLVVLGLILFAALLSNQLLDRRYQANKSLIIRDRYNQIIALEPNGKGFLALSVEAVPERFTELLLKKEDRFFNYHLGVNPISILETALSKLGFGRRQGSSTLNQQLIKLLLGQENNRTFKNKLLESWLALTFDLLRTKEQVLIAYVDTVYLGNQIQGLETASNAYFNLPADKLNDEQILQLLSSLGNPSFNNPLLGNNIESAKQLANRLGMVIREEGFTAPEMATRNLKKFTKQENIFELKTFLPNRKIGQNDIQVTIDQDLTNKIRAITQDTLPSLSSREAHNLAVVVMKLPQNEILSLIGSPDPDSLNFGQQINMLTKPRQVASTIKPFVYVRAFEKGLRSDSIIVDDKSPYLMADGRVIYPRNFDDKYRGPVTAAYALANSINVPAIKTLQLIGLDSFSEFLKQLGYQDYPKVQEHQLGAALGTLDMTLLQLTHFYTVFPNEGKMVPIKLFSNPILNQQEFDGMIKQVTDPTYPQLVNQILTDRYLAIDQFGYVSDLNLPFTNYALKTGTSDDYRDTWVIGYTPDFIVGVWVGNASNVPTDRLSGQSGAGEIWNRVMGLMAGTTYYQKTPFNFDQAEKLLLDGKEAGSGSAEVLR